MTPKENQERLRQIAWTATFATFFAGVAMYMPWMTSTSLVGPSPEGLDIGPNASTMTGAATSLHLGAGTLPNWMVAAVCFAATAMCWVRAMGVGKINPGIPTLLFLAGLLHTFLAGAAIASAKWSSIGTGLGLALIATIIASVSSAQVLLGPGEPKG